MLTDSFKAREFITKSGLEEASSEQSQHVGDCNLLRRPRENVTACLAANACNKFPLSKDTHQLADVRNRQCFSCCNRRDSHTFAALRVCDAKKASQAVLFLRTESHSIPNCSLAESDILQGPHGGSHTISTFAHRTPGIALILDCTWSGNDVATGQFGAVNVILISTLPESSTSTAYTSPNW